MWRIRDLEKLLDSNKTIESLKEQYEHHRIMMLKALGAIEVLEELQAKENSIDEEEDK